MEKKEKFVPKKAVWTKYRHTEEMLLEAIERADPKGRTCPIKEVN